MKRTVFKFRKSLLAMALVLTMFPTTIDAAFIRLVRINIAFDDFSDRRRAPAQYSDAAEAVFDGATNVFTLVFNIDASEAVITIYKDGVPVIAEAYSGVETGAAYSFDLSEYGAGQYEVVVDAGMEEDLRCGFMIE